MVPWIFYVFQGNHKVHSGYSRTGLKPT